ncbi:MAG: sensor histidine kinase [Chthoniobacteraceae bacterium]|nr:sensor histidine kinase [Chthoniobacteraceae bacterium]
MKHWPLRIKLAVWSALTVGAALLLCGVAAGLFVRHEQFEALDEQLQNEAHIFFGEYSRRHAPVDWAVSGHVKEMLPLTLTERYVEIASASGSILYRSTNMGNDAVRGAPRGFSNVEIANDAVRLGVFKDKGLVLYLAADLDEIDEDTGRILIGFLAGSPLLIATVICGGWWLSKKALAPVSAITSAAEEITAERLDRRLPVPVPPDEIRRLSTVLNAMLDRLDVSFKQAMRFSADASHELKTPLTLLRIGIENLIESPGLRPCDQIAVAALLEQTRQLTSITESLLLLSRADAGQLRLDFSETNIVEIVRACADDASIMAEKHDILIESDLPDTLYGKVDGGRLTQILLNLLDNAIKYNHTGGQVKISAKRHGNAVNITVANTGPGISPEHGPQLFQRFFRANLNAGIPGRGLGLSLARELARAHDGGDLNLLKSDAEWTVFSVRLTAVEL